MESSKKKIRILSIDWDYFINATMDEKVDMFPDAGTERFSIDLSNFIWASRYSNAILHKKRDSKNKLLTDFSVISDYQKLRKFLRNLSFKNPYTPIIIAESHYVMYPLVHENFEENDVEIVNVDFHHDLYKSTTEVNCGNWLSTLKEEGIVTKITWIKREDSDINDEYDNKTDVFISDSFDSILYEDYDIIFICRSNAWSPPHIDKKFISLITLIEKYFHCCKCEDKRVKKDRYKQIKVQIESEVDVMKEFMFGLLGNESCKPELDKIKYILQREGIQDDKTT